MHSSLRRELCSTSKVVRSVRRRPNSHSLPSTRNFTSRTSLRSQSGSKNDPNSANTNSPSPSDNKDEPSRNSAPTTQGLTSKIENLLQSLSDQGQLLDKLNNISEQDHNGRRRLLPHIREKIEELRKWSKDGNDIKRDLAFEIENGRVTATETDESKQGRDGKVESASTSAEGSAANAGSEAEIGGQNDGPKNADEITAQTATGGDGSFPELEGSSTSKFYGSPAARRQRERQSKPRDKPTVTVLPDWFGENNVIAYADKRMMKSMRNSVEFVWPTENKKAESAMVEANLNAHDAHLTESAGIIKELNAEKQTATLEEQSTAAGGDDPPDGTGQPVPKVDDSRNEDTSDQTPIQKKRTAYRMHAPQWMELFQTVDGRLRLPTSDLSHPRPGGIRSYLLVHFTAPDGDLFLDQLIEDVARSAVCSLVSLDAQDIAALISKAELDPTMLEEAKMMSYEVYGEMYDKEEPSEEFSNMFSEDMEEADEESGPPGMQGTPFIVGKPVTIDLKSLFRQSRNGGSPFLPRNVMKELTTGRSPNLKSFPTMSSSLIDSILSSPKSKRKVSHVSATEVKRLSLFDDDKRTKKDLDPNLGESIPDGTIVHVKNLRAIQETNIGKQFLIQLYDQVERRRLNGETIMIIGTECAREGSQPYSVERIKSLQVSEPDEISSTIVITPASPDSTTVAGRNTLGDHYPVEIQMRDRIKRLQTINARHLFDMLQSKDIVLDELKEGFWTKDFASKLRPADQVHLAESFWSYSYVQRIAAILASPTSESIDRANMTLSRLELAAEALERSDKLKYVWAKQTQQPNPKRKRKDDEEPENDKLAQIRAKATKHEKKLLSGVIEPKRMSTTFQDLHIPAETVEALQTLTTLSLVRPDAFKYGVLASDRIPGMLLYGPPGTGKTLAAKAVARESGATMLEVSAADINDMYVGEGEKNVKALFSLAKKLSPCVVFLDEADAMFSARSNAGRRVNHRELLNQFLKEWDGMSNDSGSAFIMVATNRPMDLDDAVLRRLPRRLLVDLPTEKDRAEILKIHLRHESLASDVDLTALASRTQFYSGSDLKNVAVAAALNCVREENELAKKHGNMENETQYEYPAKRTLTAAHFDRALEEISASISEDMTSLREIKKFDEQYGDRRGRKRKSPKWGFKTAAEADKVLDTVKVRP